jgi:heme-degrading monooxygenase HmoA
MYTRVLTFTGASDIEAGRGYVLEEALPILDAQNGFRGLSASCDLEGQLFGIMSLWETEQAREASDSALGKARIEAQKIVGGELAIENFEEESVEVRERPVPGNSLIVVRVEMDPASIPENLAHFHAEIAPQIMSRPGFRSMRTMLNPKTGLGLTGTVWDSLAAMEAAGAGVAERRPGLESRGVRFVDVSFRQLLITEIR